MTLVWVEFWDSGVLESTQDYEHEETAFAEAGMWTEGVETREAVVHDTTGYDHLVIDGGRTIDYHT